MNIAIAFEYDENNPNNWTTPQGIEHELKKNHNVERYQLNPKGCNFEKIIDNSNKYDFILCFHAGPSASFDSQLEKLKKNTKTKILIELGDEPQTMAHNQKRINFVDAFFTPDKRCRDYYISKGYKSIWMNHWCDNSIFYYNKDIETKNICVTTCGERKPYTDILPKFFKDKFINKKTEREENNQFYNSGIVVFQYARWDEITRRIFEGGGCKKAILTNRLSKETGIDDLFLEDEDICYYSNEVECVNKLSKLLYDEEYREKLSNNLYKKIINSHLTQNRSDLIINTFLSI
jgi:hypothetical protein